MLCFQCFELQMKSTVHFEVDIAKGRNKSNRQYVQNTYACFCCLIWYKIRAYKKETSRKATEIKLFEKFWSE